MTTGSDKSQSAIIQHRLPEFVQTNHPTLVAFVQAYYEWLDSQKDSGYIRTPSALDGFSDIDTTLESFVADFKKEFLLGFPEQFAVDNEGNTVDVRKLLKNIKEFYRNKGTEKTYEFLFRVLYDTAVEFYYPARDILRLSDGKWIQKYSIRCSNTLGNRIFDARGKTVVQKNSTTGAVVASGRVVDVVLFQIGNREVSELFLTNINGTFIANTKTGNENYSGIEFMDNDSVQRIEPRIYPVIRSIAVTSRGMGYRKGEAIEFLPSGDSGVGASASITEVDSVGGILKTRIDNFGIGYENAPTYEIDTAFGEGAVLAVTTGAVCVYPGYYSGSDGKLSSSKVMQDNHYYQNFSYVLLSEVVIDRYKEILRRLIHPAGMGMFGKVLLNRCSSETPETDSLVGKTEIPVIGNYVPYTIYTHKDLSELFYDDRPMPYYPSLHYAPILAATGNPTTEIIPKYHAIAFDPKNLPGLKVWLDGTYLTAAGATVSSWGDRSGNGFTATSVTTNRFPSISTMMGLHMTGSVGTAGSIMTTPSLGTINDRTMFVAFTPFPVADQTNPVTRQKNSMVVGLHRSTHAGNTGSTTGPQYQNHSICVDYLRRNLDSFTDTQPRLAAYYNFGNIASPAVHHFTNADENVDLMSMNENLLYSTESMRGSGRWSYTEDGANVGLTSAMSAIQNPFGTGTVYGFTETTANEIHRVLGSAKSTPIPNDIVTLSAYVRPNIRTSIYMSNNHVTSSGCTFVLTGNGTTSADPLVLGASIIPLPNNWYRISVTSRSRSSDGAVAWQLYSSVGVGNNSAPAFYAWGPQVTRGAELTPYIQTELFPQYRPLLRDPETGRKIIPFNTGSVVYNEFQDLESITASNPNTSIVCSVLGEGYPTSVLNVLSLTAETVRGDTGSNNDLTIGARYNRYRKMAEYMIPEGEDGSYAFSMDQAIDYSPSELYWKSAITKNDGLVEPENRSLTGLSNVIGEWTWATMSDGLTAPLDLDFTTGSLDSRITFSRASTGSYYAGKPNQNLLYPSQSFGNPSFGSSWALVSQYGGGGFTANYDGSYVQNNAAIAPDGTKTAARVVMNRGVGVSSTDRTLLQGIAQNYGQLVMTRPYTFSVWLRGTKGNERVRLRNVAGSDGSTISLTTSWQRYSLTQLPFSPTNGTVFVGKYGSDGGQQIDTIEVWGAQLSEGSEVTPYIPTTTSVVIQGQLAYAAANSPRFEFDPVTGDAQGLLIEGSSTNLCLQSGSIRTSPWGNGNLTGQTPSIIAPDGTLSGVPLVWNNGVASGNAYSIQTITAAASTAYAYSVFLKPFQTNINTRLGFVARDSSNAVIGTILCLYNHTTNQISFTDTTGFSSTSAHIRSAGNGWHRISVVGTTPAATTSIYVALIGNSTGNGVDGVYAWGAQFEQKDHSTSYIPTAGATAARLQDNASITGSNFSSWYNQSGGSLYTEQVVTAFGANANQSAAYLVQNNNNFIAIGQGVGQGGTPGSNSALYIMNGGVQQVFESAFLSLRIGDTVRTTATFYKNDFAWASNGSMLMQDFVGTLPSPSSLELGTASHQRSASVDSRLLKRIVYWPHRIPNEAIANISLNGTEFPARIYTPNAYKTHKIAVKDMKAGDVVRVWMSPSENSGIKPQNSSLNTSKNLKLKNFKVDRAFGQGENILTVDGNKIGSTLARLDGMTAGQRLVMGLGENYFNGVIHEVLVYDRALNSRERETVEAYLHYKWKKRIISAANHTWSLPVSPWEPVAESGTTGTNLFGNPSFESPSVPNASFTTFSEGSTGISGMIVLNSPISIVRTNYTASGYSFVSNSGNQWLDLSGDGGMTTSKGVLQVINTEPDQQYNLSFYVGTVRGSTSSDFINIPPTTIDVSINQGPRISYTNNNLAPSQMNWKLFSTMFVASGATTSIAFFYGNTGPSGPFNFACGLDDVSVTKMTSKYGIHPALPEDGGITANATTGSSLLGYPFFEVGHHPNVSLSQQDTYAARILAHQSHDFLGMDGTGSAGYWPEWTEGSTANRQNWAIGLSAEGSRHAILQYSTSSEFRKITPDAFFDMKAGRQFDCKDEYVTEPEYPKVSLDYSEDFSNSSAEDPIYSNGSIVFHFNTQNAENMEYWTTDLLELSVSDGRGEYFYRPNNMSSKTILGFVSDGTEAKQYTVTVRLLDFYGKPIPDSENSVTFWFKYLSTAGTYDSLS